ncbi:MAG: hypothetical protein JRN15_22255 [Nitrososphaerota archaeon]|nr:hypothetical protein [Nitrososphaerota archaeon]
MPSSLPPLNLELAWKRVMHYHKDRTFVTNPFLDSWLDFSRADWLGHVGQRLFNGYEPTPPTSCWIPKEGGLCRPGVVLSPEDEIVFYTLLDAMLPEISIYVQQVESVALHPRLVRDISRVSLLEYYKNQWKYFRSKSTELLNNGLPYMVNTDITSFYSSINIKSLISIMADLNIAQELRALLAKCLNTWSHNLASGIPQGFMPSDVLSLVFLAETDVELRRSGISHLRYSDDIRIFAATETEAKRYLHKLDCLLLRRGLWLNSSKTEILHGEKAISKISAQGKQIDAVNRDFMDIYRTEMPMIGPYTPFWEIAAQIPHSQATPEARVKAEQRFDEFMSSYQGGNFDRSLFHFLLPWLGALDSPHAIEPCKEILPSHPSEANYILKYFKKFHNNHDIAQFLMDLAIGPNLIYDHTRYEIAKWLYEVGYTGRSAVQWARSLLEGQKHDYLKAYAMAIIGRAGDRADWEYLFRRYHDGLNDISKAETIHSIARMELSRRNGFYRQVENESFFTKMAVKYVKALSGNINLLFPTSISTSDTD